MTESNRKAGVLWNGDLRSGVGMVSTESQALYEQPFNYQTRFGEQLGTNPEELLAAAHAACFSMALASTLKKNGFEPKKTDTNATCTVVPKDGGYEITRMQLHVRAEVPGINDAAFLMLVKEADKGCPVSNLLRSGLDIEIDAVLK
jgi:osmotically inducible protein OsmC